MNDFYISSPEPQKPDDFYTDSVTAPVQEPESAPAAPALPFSVHYRTMTRIGLSLAVLAAAFIVFGYGLDIAAYYLFPSLPETWWYNWVVTDIPLYCIALPLMWLVLRSVPVSPFNETYRRRGVLYRKSPFGFGLWTVTAVIGLGFMYIGSYATTVFTEILSAATGREYMDALQSLADNSPLWMLFIGTVIIAPLGEEFIFRKLLIDRTRQYGDIPAILLSAVTFALFHRNLFQLFYTFLLGAVLAYLYTRTGKYRLCVALHALVNLYTGVISKVINDGITPEGEPENILAGLLASVFGMAALGLLAASVVLTVCLRRRIKLSGGTQGLSRGQTAALFCGNAGIILFAVICTVLTVFTLISLSAIA